MSSKIYKISLSPLGSFYFGGEANLGMDGQTTYLVKSNLYPQQTALLGMLRFQLLKQNNLLPLKENEADAKKLIGQESFNGLKEQSFGAIHEIYPLFLELDGKPLSPIPMGYKHSLKAREGKSCFYGESINDSIPYLTKVEDGEEKKYNEKDGFTEGYAWCDKVIKLDDFAIARQRVGIKKKQKDEAFFKITNYQFKKCAKTNNAVAKFCFYLKLDDIKPFKLSNAIVKLGGDASTFKMEIEDIEQAQSLAYSDTFLPKSQVKDICTLTLLSPAYVKPEIYDNCYFSLTKTIPFRSLQSNISETENYYSVSKFKDKKSSLVTSSRKNLIDRGSVFFVKKDKVSKFEEEFKNTAFQNIGYNFLDTKTNQP